LGQDHVVIYTVQTGFMGRLKVNRRGTTPHGPHNILIEICISPEQNTGRVHQAC